MCFFKRIKTICILFSLLQRGFFCNSQNYDLRYCAQYDVIQCKNWWMWAKVPSSISLPPETQFRRRRSVKKAGRLIYCCSSIEFWLIVFMFTEMVFFIIVVSFAKNSGFSSMLDSFTSHMPFRRLRYVNCRALKCHFHTLQNRTSNSICVCVWMCA